MWTISTAPSTNILLTYLLKPHWPTYSSFASLLVVDKLVVIHTAYCDKRPSGALHFGSPFYTPVHRWCNVNVMIFYWNEPIANPISHYLRLKCPSALRQAWRVYSVGLYIRTPWKRTASARLTFTPNRPLLNNSHFSVFTHRPIRNFEILLEMQQRRKRCVAGLPVTKLSSEFGG